MQERILRWVPIALFLLLATFGYVVRAKNAAQTPCRPNPEICQPQQEPPPVSRCSVRTRTGDNTGG